jgi:hypothetical protein
MFSLFFPSLREKIDILVDQELSNINKYVFEKRSPFSWSNRLSKAFVFPHPDLPTIIPRLTPSLNKVLCFMNVLEGKKHS